MLYKSDLNQVDWLWNDENLHLRPDRRQTNFLIAISLEWDDPAAGGKTNVTFGLLNG